MDERPRILIVDDDNSARVLLRETLEQDGYAVDEAADEDTALALFDHRTPDVVLLEPGTPRMDGFSVCSRMHNAPAAANAAIVMVTSLNDEESIAKAFDAGASDYVTKPINHALLRHRLRRTIADRRHQTQVNYRAHYDALTGLPNRALLIDRFRHALARARRRGEPVALLYLDLDGFKQINDTMGHDAGDRFLKEVGERLAGFSRSCDTVARLGGDEFVMLLTTAVSENGVRTVATKLLGLLSEPLPAAKGQVSVTASLGAALYPGHGDDIGTLIRNADAAMYSAKENGGNTYRWSGAAARRWTTTVG